MKVAISRSHCLIAALVLAFCVSSIYSYAAERDGRRDAQSASDTFVYRARSIGRARRVPTVFAASSPALSSRIAVFRANGFPTVDAPPISQATLNEALARLSSVTLDNLEKLSSQDH